MRSESAFSHVPVLLEECLTGLDLREGKTYVDCTLGGGGHSLEILRRTKTAKLIGVDKDEDALRAAGERLKEFSDRITLIRRDFKETEAILQEAGVRRVDGVLMDLGVSSFQLDCFERGFSYRAEEAPLDMRMDRRQALTAEIVVNTYDRQQLIRVLREYGEEKFAPRIADFILREREEKPIRTCGELVDLIYRAIPAPARRTGGHPAKRTFMALRIEVNGELANLKEAVRNWTMALNEGGRICVITFHSLEDRIVKHLFKELESDCVCPPGMPVCRCDKMQEIEILTKRPVEPGAEEKEQNPRAESAKLRIAKKVLPRKRGQKTE